MSNFNVNLKKIREKKGLTAKEVAIDLGIPYTTYLKYEGVGEPRYDTLIKIADYLNVSIDTLLGYTPNEYEYYKQWLLSFNNIDIDDKQEPIYIYSRLPRESSVYTLIIKPTQTDYKIAIPTKEKFIYILRIIKGIATESQKNNLSFIVATIFNNLCILKANPSSINNKKVLQDIINAYNAKDKYSVDDIYDIIQCITTIQE